MYETTTAQDQLASSQCNLYKQEQVVAPSNIHHKSFTVGVTDNQDHDFTSTTSSSSFHGTATRKKRGTRARTKVSGSTKIPKNWNDFLRDDDNKVKLFWFLAMRISLSKF